MCGGGGGGEEVMAAVVCSIHLEHTFLVTTIFVSRISNLIIIINSHSKGQIPICVYMSTHHQKNSTHNAYENQICVLPIKNST